MNHFTFQRRTRPLPMLLTGALLTPLALLAGCGSTPDEPAPAPVELAPAPAEGAAAEEPEADAAAQAEALDLAAAPPAEVAPEEEEVDLQVAGMRAALEKAMRDSGIDPVTLEATDGPEPAPEAAAADEVLAAEDGSPEEPAGAAAEDDAAQPALAAADAPETEAAPTDSQAENTETVAADLEESSDEESDLVVAAEEPAVEAQADTVAEAPGEAAVEAQDDLVAETQGAETEADEVAGTPVAAQPDGAGDELAAADDGADEQTEQDEADEPSLSPAEQAMLEAELALLELDPSRVGPVAFEDFGAVPMEPEAPAEELVLAEDATDEAPAAEAEASAEDAELAVVVPEPELAVPAFAPVQDAGMPGFAMQPSDWPHEHTELVAALDDLAAEQAALALEDAATEGDHEEAFTAAPVTNSDAALAQVSLETEPAPASSGPDVDVLVDMDADTEDTGVAQLDDAAPGKSGAPADLAKYGAIQWQLVEYAPTTLTQVDVPVEPALEGDPATGAGALPIERVEVPAALAAQHGADDWGSLEFLRGLPLEERALLTPLAVLDPSGGLALMGTSLRGFGEVSNMALTGPPQDPALAGLSYSDGSEFDPAPIDPTAVVVDEPGIGMIWWSEEVPLAQIDAASEIQTPSVGRVRIVLHSGDYVEGSLHSVGQGSYWIDGELGRFAVRGSLVSHVERLPKPGLGQQVTGLQAGDLVRAKVKTGYIEGRLISMKDGKALVETATGMRITIEGAEVEPMGKSKTRVIVD